jgi:hypothetical protein
LLHSYIIVIETGAEPGSVGDTLLFTASEQINNFLTLQYFSVRKHENTIYHVAFTLGPYGVRRLLLHHLLLLQLLLLSHRFYVDLGRATYYSFVHTVSLPLYVHPTFTAKITKGQTGAFKMKLAHKLAGGHVEGKPLYVRVPNCQTGPVLVHVLP